MHPTYREVNTWQDYLRSDFDKYLSFVLRCERHSAAHVPLSATAERREDKAWHTMKLRGESSAYDKDRLEVPHCTQWSQTIATSKQIRWYER